MTDNADQEAPGEDETPILETDADDQLEGDEVDGEEEEDDLELDDKSYRVPKSVKAAIEAARTEAASAAEQRAIIEQRAQEEREATARRQAVVVELQSEQAALKATEALIARWREFTPETQEEADQKRDALDVLKDQREQQGQALGQKWRETEAKLADEARQTDAAALKEFEAGLAKIPGWTKEVGEKVFEHAAKRYGAATLATIRDPRVVEDLYDAYRYRQSQKSTARQKQVIDQPTPPKPLKGGAAPAPLSDRAPTEAWMKARQAQIKRRA